MSGRVQLPSHAYVPGLTRRHPEGTFDVIRDSVKPEMSPAELARCEALRHGLVYIEEGFYWEAHEVLEPIWMVLAKGSAERALLQGLIQLANGHLKIRMNRPKASRRLLTEARDLIDRAGAGRILEIDHAHASNLLDSLERTILQEEHKEQGHGN